MGKTERIQVQVTQNYKPQERSPSFKIVQICLLQSLVLAESLVVPVSSHSSYSSLFWRCSQLSAPRAYRLTQLLFAMRPGHGFVAAEAKLYLLSDLS